MIYLDHNASAPMTARARDALVWALDNLPGNPSSAHALGRAARAALEEARAQVAALCGCLPSQVLFTSGGTESNNLAINDLIHRALRAGRRHVLASPLEHPSVLAPLQRLSSLKAIDLEWLPVHAHGLLDPAEAARLLRPLQTGLLCCMAAHNTLGALYPVEALTAAARACGALVHCDAAQAPGRVAVAPLACADTLSLSAHKLGGPKGVGALITRAPLTSPLLLGGGQEQGARSGTENLPCVVGFGAAAQGAAQDLLALAQHTRALQHRLWSGLQRACPTAQRNTPPDASLCLPNTLHVSFLGVDGLVLAKLLDRHGVAVSTGSACLSKSGGADTALRATGLSLDALAGSLRLSLGPTNTAAEVDLVLALLPTLLPDAQRIDDKTPCM
jgi:cysteine desulfurase